MARKENLQDRLDAAAQLVQMFRPERLAYLVATILAVAFLMITAIILLLQQHTEMALGMFASSGVITFSIGRLLKLWSQVLHVIFNTHEEQE